MLDVDEMTRLGRVGEIQVSPDGAWAAVVVQRLSADGGKYVADLWRVPIDGGPAVQLTRTDVKDGSPRFRKDGALAFLSNRNPRPGDAEPGDAERMQVWLLPAAGEPVPVTDEPLGVTDFAWAGDDLVLLAETVLGVAAADTRKAAADRGKHGPTALHFKKREVLRHWNEWLPPTSLHLVHRAADGTRTDLTPDARHELRGLLADQVLAVSPDGSEVAVLWSTMGAHRIPESAIRRYTLATGAHVVLGARELVMYHQLRWTPDGATLVAVRQETRRAKADLLRLWKFAAGDAVGAELAPDWDAAPTLHAVTPDGRAVLCTADHEGVTPVYRVSLDGAVDRVTAVAAAGTHDQVRALPGGGRAAVVRSTHLAPPEVFVVDLAAEATPRPLAALSGFARDRGAQIADVEEAWVQGDGGERVQYFLIKPRGVARPPVLFWIHGGPIAQFSDGWHWRWNVLVAASAGFAVALPNPRGSTGRGQGFADAVCGNEWGGACYRDLVAVADALAVRSDVDGARMAAMGGSFGGYMVNWIGGQGHRFRAIVSHASIFGFRAFHGTCDYPGYFTIELGGSPWGDDGVDYAKYSPDTFVTRWKTPTLILHGEKDYRCPIGEGLQLYEVLDAHGVDVELVVFPDEGHWIMRPRNIKTWYKAWLDFVGARLAV